MGWLAVVPSKVSFDNDLPSRGDQTIRAKKQTPRASYTPRASQRCCKGGPDHAGDVA